MTILGWQLFDGLVAARAIAMDATKTEIVGI